MMLTLTDAKADVNFMSQSGKTALMMAATKGHLDAVQTLLSHEADPKLCDRAGLSALDHAVDAGEPSVVAALLDAGCPVDGTKGGKTWTPIMRCAAVSGSTSVARFLLSRGADPNLPDHEGKRPLLMAVVNKNEALAKALLAAGADPTLQSSTGETPMAVACNAKADKLVELLRSRIKAH